MKSTGITRRIDDLGRIVLPKEIRRNMLINDGDPIEIFIEGDVICLKKYDPAVNIQERIKQLKCAVDELQLQNQSEILKLIRDITKLL